MLASSNVRADARFRTGRLEAQCERVLVLAAGAAAILFGAHSLGCFAPENARLFGILSLGCAVVVICRRSRVGWEAWATFACGLFLSLSVEMPAAWAAGFALALCGLSLPRSAASVDLLALGTGGVVAAFLLLAVEGAPALWLAFSGVSLDTSELLGGVGGVRTRLGPSASGLWPLALVGALVLGFASVRRIRPWRFLVIVVLVVAALAGYQLIVQGVAAGTRNSAYRIATLQWALALLVFPSLWVAAGACRRGRWPTSIGARSIAALVAAGAALGLTFAPPPSATSGARVRLLDEGYVDWEVPTYGRYGVMQTGLFGQLPRYLRMLGQEPRVAPGPVTREALDETDVLVVINPQRRWSDGELEAIWRFVDAGGALLVLGDHTDLVGTRDPLNQLLRPAGISFRFDSGFPCREGWWHGLQPLRHPAVAGVGSWDEAIVSVGATLDVRPPAYPVLVGRYGFSDRGNVLNVEGAYLGDYLYQHGEQLGDVILVAAARVGKGRVVVFGDTSTFQNGALTFSVAPFVEPLVTWLASRDASHPWGAAAGLGLFGLGVLALLRVARDARGVALVALAVFLGASGGSGASRPLPTALQGEIVWLDLAHHPRVSLAALQDDGIGAAITNLTRSGYQPVAMRNFDAEVLSRGRMFLTVAPMREYTEAEIDALEAFARSGGLVTVASGWSDRHGSERLLARFGIQIAPVPLGPLPIIRDDPKAVALKPAFVDAWSVQARPGAVGGSDVVFVPSEESTPGRGVGPAERRGRPGADGFTRSFYQVDGFTVVGFREVGAGGVLVIGDSRFLTDMNLETRDYYREGNILFLRDVLASVRPDLAP